MGPRLAERFAARDIRSVGDALFFIPRRYEDRRAICRIRDLRVGQIATVAGEVVDLAARRTGPRRNVLELVVSDGSGALWVRWFNFNAESFKKRYQRRDRVRLAGQVGIYQGRLQMTHPEIEKIEDGSAPPGPDFASIVPIYPEIEGIFPKALRKIQRRVVERFAPMVREILPEELRRRLGFPPIAQALGEVHFPPSCLDPAALAEIRTPAQRRVVFEEFFLLQLGMALRARRIKQEPGRAFPVPDDLDRLARELFGFALTNGQRQVLSDILHDMASPRPMNRLLQGDVGSGKTAVAVLAAVVAARNGAQTAFMAPTEILAEQHRRRLAMVLSQSSERLSTVLLTSAVKGSERTRALAEIQSGRAQLVIGTQALIEEGVVFSDLGLCVIDEQHRFGVLQRARLRHKGRLPDVLVMTATPIPRTLAMTVYGDLEVSLLSELPPGRTPVRTVVLRGSEVERAYRHVRREAENGGQAYLVYPLVDESDKVALRSAVDMFQRLRDGVFSGLRVGLVHGRMPAAEKDAVMAAFAANEIHVLVSTTVIEVGVDVPNASLMIVEDAENFGLSQLHQLRGRVGRGARPAVCYLVAHRMASPEARSRLKVMESTQDGFRVAEADLALRGPGEFLGTRQSGLPSFLYADLVRDSDVLELARREAFALVERDPALERPEHRELRRSMENRFGRKIALAEVG